MGETVMRRGSLERSSLQTYTEVTGMPVFAALLEMTGRTVAFREQDDVDPDIDEIHYQAHFVMWCFDPSSEVVRQ